MPDEKGYDFADEVVGRPDERAKDKNWSLYLRVLRLYNHSKDKPEARKIPLGTLEKAERQAAKITHRNTETEKTLRNKRIVREILRDARNHLDAVQMSGAAVPFWSIDDGEFIGLLDGSEEQFEREQADVSPESRRYFSDYLRQALELLKNLEKPRSEIEGKQDRPQYEWLHKFLNSEAHTELAGWLSYHANRSRFVDLREKELLEALRAGLIPDFPRRNVEYLFQLDKRRLMRLIGTLSIIMTVGPVLLDPDQKMGLASLSLFLIPVVERLIFTPDYQGFRWPFLYAFGEEPSAARLAELRQLIDRLLAESGMSVSIHAVPRRTVV